MYALQPISREIILKSNDPITHIQNLLIMPTGTIILLHQQKATLKFEGFSKYGTINKHQYNNCRWNCCRFINHNQAICLQREYIALLNVQFSTTKWFGFTYSKAIQKLIVLKDTLSYVVCEYYYNCQDVKITHFQYPFKIMWEKIFGIQNTGFDEFIQINNSHLLGLLQLRTNHINFHLINIEKRTVIKYRFQHKYGFKQSQICWQSLHEVNSTQFLLHVAFVIKRNKSYMLDIQTEQIFQTNILEKGTNLYKIISNKQWLYCIYSGVKNTPGTIQIYSKDSFELLFALQLKNEKQTIIQDSSICTYQNTRIGQCKLTFMELAYNQRLNYLFMLKKMGFQNSNMLYEIIQILKA